MLVKNRLKEIRMKEYMMTSTDFSKFLHVSNTTYSNWELEKAKPSLETALSVAKILKKSIDEIWYLE